MSTKYHYIELTDSTLRMLFAGAYLLICSLWVLWGYLHYQLVLVTWKNLINFEVLLSGELRSSTYYFWLSVCVSGYIASMTILIPIKLSAKISRLLPTG